ncbi:MAG: hypothetical protein LBI03_07085, partial [Clostridiales bacterium]|nr:hypothetical protein [Clostridiales bacterium]
ILIGSKGAGKTSLSRKLRNAYFPLPGKGKSTAGVDTFKLKLFPKEVTHLWDFGGHVIIQAAHKCFMSAECLYVLVMYGRTQRQEIDDYREWLVTVQTYSGGNARVFIVLNEFDKHSFDMPEEELKKEFGELIEGFYSFNFKKDRVKLRKLKDDIRSYIEKNFSRELPIKYFSIKQEIEQQFRKNKRELLTKKDVENIALACGLKGDYEDALKYLNILGVALSYDDIPELVLNPSWISNGVYTIINYMQKVRNSQIYFDKIPTLFIGKNSKRYGFKNCKYLYDLMVEYKLAFPVEGDTNTLLVPAALPDTKPSGIPEPLQGEKTLRRRYCFKTALPEDIFPKYIQMNHDNIKYVRRNDKTDYIVWCSGMSLVWENTNAMIYKESREVEIIVWGENKGDFLLKLNNRFHDLLSESDLKWEREEIKLPRGYYETDVIRELYQKDETIELGGEKINKAIKEYNLSLINLNVNLKAGFNPEVSINALNKTKNSG